MANPMKGEVPVTLEDGRQLVLVLDMEALIEGEAAYGKPMRVMMQDASREFMGAMRAVLFGSMRAHHPEITLREAGQMLASPVDGKAVAEALGRAAELGFTKGEAGAEGKQGANPPPGTTSGGSGAKQSSNPRRSGGKRRAPSS